MMTKKRQKTPKNAKKRQKFYFKLCYFKCCKTSINKEILTQKH